MKSRGNPAFFRLGFCGIETMAFFALAPLPRRSILLFVVAWRRLLWPVRCAFRGGEIKVYCLKFEFFTVLTVFKVCLR
jgi:hypothetical protein